MGSLSDGRCYINHMPDKFQIDPDGSIHEVVLSHVIDESKPRFFLDHNINKPLPNTHYRLEQDGSITELIKPEVTNWGEGQNGKL